MDLVFKNSFKFCPVAFQLLKRHFKPDVNNCKTYTTALWAHYLQNNNWYDQNILTMVLLNKNQHIDFYAAVTPLGLPPVSNLKCLNSPFMNLSLRKLVCIREDIT